MKKFESKTYFELDYDELDNLINETYNTKQFESMAIEEWHNYMSRSFHINKQQLNKYDLEDLEEYTSGRKYACPVRIVLTDMCNKEIIPEGNYLIHIFW